METYVFLRVACPLYGRFLEPCIRFIIAVSLNRASDLPLLFSSNASPVCCCGFLESCVRTFTRLKTIAADKLGASEHAALAESLRSFVESKSEGTGLTCPVTFLQPSGGASFGGESSTAKTTALDPFSTGPTFLYFWARVSLFPVNLSSGLKKWLKRHPDGTSKRRWYFGKCNRNDPAVHEKKGSLNNTCTAVSTRKTCGTTDCSRPAFSKAESSLCCLYSRRGNSLCSLLAEASNISLFVLPRGHVCVLPTSLGLQQDRSRIKGGR